MLYWCGVTVQRCGLCQCNLPCNSWKSATWNPKPEIKSLSNPQTLDPVTAILASQVPVSSRLELAVYHLERYTQDEVVLEWPLVTQSDHTSVWFPCCPTVRLVSGFVIYLTCYNTFLTVLKPCIYASCKNRSATRRI